MVVKIGKTYQYFDGNLYKVVAIAKDRDTGKDMVVYQELFGYFSIYVCPYDKFESFEIFNEKSESRNKSKKKRCKHE